MKILLRDAIEHVLFCSTAHIPKDIADQFAADLPVPGTAHFNIEFGWLVWFGKRASDNGDDSKLDPRLVPLRDAARTHGAGYIRFDQDAACIHNLPTWEW